MKKTSAILLSFLMICLLVVSGGGFTVVHHICYTSGNIEASLIAHDHCPGHEGVAELPGNKSSCCSNPEKEAEVPVHSKCCSEQPKPVDGHELKAFCCEQVIQKNFVDVVCLQGKDNNVLTTAMLTAVYLVYFNPFFIVEDPSADHYIYSPPLLKTAKSESILTQAFLI